MEDGNDGSALLFETVKRIREWVDSTFQEDVAKRFHRKGHLKGRFLVKLTDEMWNQLKVYIQASFSLSKLQLTKGESLGQPCIDLAAGATGAGHAATRAAAAPLQASCDQASKRPADDAATASRGKRAKVSAGGQTTDPEAYDAYEVREGPKGLEEARDALKAAMREACEAGEKKGQRARCEALRWLKGLEQRKVSARELAQTKIGLVVNEWRQVFNRVFKDQASKERAHDLLSSWRKLWLEAKALNFAS
ncbi:unnamed protein product [Cladocopium goreaui]|uniref:TFIIS N-terminal domain-containing protein n=1 Tax=Cladocopium goreaui TaxID=2562237 RepID=A0A9P1BNS4_9DINO|nr:unnamed protein product [Cladocopium goreaui]